MEAIKDEFIVREITKDHIYNVINNTFKCDKPKYKFTKDNMQTYAVTIHPNFIVWLYAISINGIGGEPVIDNSKAELFGQGNEGCHSMLIIRTFKQLGEYQIQHYTRCSSSVEMIYNLINKNDINVLYAFMVCCELASFIFEGIKDSLQLQYPNQEFEYLNVHLDVDNHDDGHGIQMLKQLESKNSSNMTPDQFNKGIQLFRKFFLHIFDN